MSVLTLLTNYILAFFKGLQIQREGTKKGFDCGFICLGLSASVVKCQSGVKINKTSSERIKNFDLSRLGKIANRQHMACMTE